MRLYTIRLIATLAFIILMAPLATEAQQATKVYRVGRLLGVGSPPSGPDSLFEAFRQGLHDLGYAEDQNLVIEARYAEGSLERYRDLAAELVRLQVDMIVAGGVAAIRAAPGWGRVRWSQERAVLVGRSWRDAVGGGRLRAPRRWPPTPAPTRGGRGRPRGGLLRCDPVGLGRSWGEEGRREHQGKGPCQVQRPTRACT